MPVNPIEWQSPGAVSRPQLPATRSEGGFRAVLADAGIWDLVQMNCESRARSTVRVGSGTQYGFLFFDAGQIVHAIVGTAAGERAALEILSWRGGSWESWEHAWPERTLIDAPWQGLLLRAAQRIDEAGRPQPAARVARLIAVGAPAAPAREIAPMRLTDPPPANGTESAQRASGEQTNAYRSQDFEHAVRMDPNGAITAGQGQVQQFAALAGYACRVGDLIGELLGMGKLAGIDGALAHGTECLIFRKATGETVALRPRPGVDLTQLKEQLQL